MALRYRADVDGLRAIAVLSVVFFHLSQSILPGGFLGVDMFFVVSGFLITSIIWSEINEGVFSISHFYSRRIRRILPALLAVLFFTTGVSAILLLPVDLIGYSKSLLSTLTFVANVYFWRDTNYFSRGHENKPLLHMWSLGVEEQFYIIFPLVLIVLSRLSPRFALYIIITITVASFGLDMFMLFTSNDSPAFYLLPTRAWELGAGAVLALSPAHPALRPMTINAIATAGTLLLAVGIFHPLAIYSFPVATPVVIGTGLLILAGQYGYSTMSRTLRLQPIVFIGLMSYSIYLWHWPIIVFYQYFVIRDLTSLEIMATLAVITLCATLSWRFIERPFRGKIMATRTVLYITGAGIMALTAISAPLLISDGLPGRLTVEAASINEAIGGYYSCPVREYILFGRSRVCPVTLPSKNPADADVILLGNSHAGMYAPIWASILAEHNRTGLLFVVTNCLPTVEINYTRYCIDIAKRSLNAVASLRRARIVILGLTWPQSDTLVDRAGNLIQNPGNSTLIAALDSLIEEIHSMGKKVILIGPIAEPGWDVPSIISRQIAFNRPHDRPIFLEKHEFMDRFGPVIQHFEQRNDIGFVRADRVQCGEERCLYLIDGRSLFADGNHIAARELWRFRSLFEASLLQNGSG
ncbi:MAG TPA: acyltransferase family protein [Methylocella sp.]|nr:acyltransferase family protein [Methylocella sp.]